jgi:hypothetical protein
MQANIDFEITIVPTDGISAANYTSGDFGRSPFFVQLSGKPQPAATHVSVVAGIKAQGCSKVFIRGGAPPAQAG